MEFKKNLTYFFKGLPMAFFYLVVFTLALISIYYVLNFTSYLFTLIDAYFGLDIALPRDHGFSTLINNICLFLMFLACVVLPLSLLWMVILLSIQIGEKRMKKL